jgi:hypothetical protein
MALSSTERSRIHRERKRHEAETERQQYEAKIAAREKAHAASWSNSLVDYGIIYPGEVIHEVGKPAVNVRTKAESILADRQWCAALHIPGPTVGETSNNLMRRIYEAWSKLDCPGLLSRSARFSKNEMFKMGQPEELDFWWDAEDDKGFATRPFTADDIKALPRLMPPFGATDEELEKLEERKRIEASYLHDVPSEVWETQILHQVSFADPSRGGV